jgi:hypothetical protein
VAYIQAPAGEQGGDRRRRARVYALTHHGVRVLLGSEATFVPQSPPSRHLPLIFPPARTVPTPARIAAAAYIDRFTRARLASLLKPPPPATLLHTSAPAPPPQTIFFFSPSLEKYSTKNNEKENSFDSATDGKAAPQRVRAGPGAAR